MLDKYVYGSRERSVPEGRDRHTCDPCRDVVGEHTVIFAGNRERIELTHRAIPERHLPRVASPPSAGCQRERMASAFHGRGLEL